MSIRGLVEQNFFGNWISYQTDYHFDSWTQVYSSDVFARFGAQGSKNTVAALEPRKLILSQGGTQDERVMVTTFLGRDPNSEAFLRHLGPDLVMSRYAVPLLGHGGEFATLEAHLAP
ncbi:MAG: hypothetical protein JKY61_12630 [Planctomycetes bacterium]|nr:hypothetical protein [Planctomycetota bacterium]